MRDSRDDGVQSTLKNSGVYIGTNNGTVNVGPTQEQITVLIKGILITELEKCTGEAKLVFEKRISELSAQLYSLRVDFTKMKHAFSEPSFQMDCFEACKAYGRTGSPEHLKILCELLKGRIQCESSSLVEVTLSECIKAIPLLDSRHLSFLALLMYLSDYGTYFSPLYKERLLAQTVKKIYLPLLSKTKDLTRADIRHLIYARCITTLPRPINITETLLLKMEAAFRKPTPIDDVVRVNGVSLFELHPKLFGFVGDDHKNVIVSAQNSSMLSSQIDRLKLSPAEIVALKKELDKERCSLQEARQILNGISADWDELCSAFEKRQTYGLSVTSVGAVLGTMVLRSELHLGFEPEDGLGIHVRRGIPLEELRKTAEYFDNI